MGIYKTKLTNYGIYILAAGRMSEDDFMELSTSYLRLLSKING